MRSSVFKAHLSWGAFLLLSGASMPAYAHADLVKTVPAQEEAIAAPLEEIRLTFTEAPELAFSEVSIGGANLPEVELGELSLDTEDNKTLIVPIEGELSPGAYTVQWTVVSADGHKVEGQYVMNVAP